MIIDFNYYDVEIYNGHYIITGNKPLMIKTKYLLCGNSNRTIDTFIPTNFILIKNYKVYNNFMTNLYIPKSFAWKP